MRKLNFGAVLVTSTMLLLSARPVLADNSGVNRPFRDKWAVVIGVSKFVKGELDLKYAAADARSFYDYLVKDGNFAKDHVKLVTDLQANRRNILSTLGGGWLGRHAGPEDLVVVYISSHGSPSELDVEGVNYLLAADSDPDDLYSSGIDMQVLSRMIKAKIHANRVVLFLDTCHSGAAESKPRKANVSAAKIAESTGQIVVASSQPNQASWECASQPMSVFTYCLLDGLRSKGNLTTLDQAFGHLKEKVQTTVMQERGELQTPVMKGSWDGGGLVIAARPSAPTAALDNDAPALSVVANSVVKGEDGTKVLSNRVAILPFGEGGSNGIGEIDFDGLAVRLEEMVRYQLSDALQERLLSSYAVGSALGKSSLGGGLWTADTRPAMGKALNAKYIVKVDIQNAHFDPTGNCDFSVSVCIASGETGEYLWSGGQKAAGAFCAGDASAKLAYLKTQVLPASARFIRRAILSTVDSSTGSK
ncbi:caspase family protein [bacterium]|nr:caspase family protein [bacterium]